MKRTDANVFVFQLQQSQDILSLSQTGLYPSVSAKSENTPSHTSAGTATMETAANKHRGFSQRQSRDTAGLSEVSSGFFTNSVPEDRMSPTNSADMSLPLASSRESVLSEGSDKDRTWSALQPSSVTSPTSLSRTVSPCSSVLSGIFSPAVVPIKRHVLAPGSSLIHTPQSCFSSSESLSSSTCPQSPPPRRRPPLTRLSLLTAILRKGRLPVLSPAPQRPYTPCWPVNPVTLSFCNACSAASNVASMPLELSPQFPSSASIDSQNHIHREPHRCTTDLLPVQPNEPNKVCPQTRVQRCTPRWEQVISPPPAKGGKLPPTPLPVLCSKSVPPPPEIDCTASTKLQQTHISVSPKLRPSNVHIKGHIDNKTNFPLPSKYIKKQETPAPQKWSHTPNSSLSRLHTLSQQLRSLPSCSPQLQPSLSPSVTNPASPLPPASLHPGARCESERSWPASKSAAASEGFHNARCLTPSRYTPVVSPGWPSPNGSPTPTPSPAPPNRDLSPSPFHSLRSTPSPRPGSGISDCSDREGKKRKVAALPAICMTFF